MCPRGRPQGQGRPRGPHLCILPWNLSSDNIVFSPAISMHTNNTNTRFLIFCHIANFYKFLVS